MKQMITASLVAFLISCGGRNSGGSAISDAKQTRAAINKCGLEELLQLRGGIP